MGIVQQPDPATLMPEQPGAGVVPPAPAQYQFAQPAPAQAAQPGGVHYNILSRLMGAKHAADVQDKQDYVKFLMDSIHAGYQNPDSVPEQQMLEWGKQVTKLIGHPEVTKAINADIDRHLASNKAKKALGTVNATEAQGGAGTIGQGGTGVPPAAAGLESLKGSGSLPWYAAQPTAAMPAPAPAPIPNTSLFAPQAQPQGGSPFAPQVAVQAAKPPQSPPPGMPAPPVPFGSGGDTGATPPANIPAPVKLASDTGGAGFGVRPQPVAAAPVNLATGFGRYSPEEAGMRIAARELPSARQTNALALEHAGAVARQATELKIAESQRVLSVLRATPGYKDLPALQRIEMEKQALGIPGTISNLARPLNLPKSQIHGPDTPEGALGIDGRPIDRSPGRFYEQQQDIPTQDIRYYPSSPRVNTIQRMTTAGPVLVSTDYAGNIIKVASAIDGKTIVDPRMLATVRESLMPVPVVTKDANGDPQTTWVMKESSTSSRRALPGQGGASATPQTGGGTVPVPQSNSAPQAGAPQAGTPRRGITLPPTMPKADPASITSKVLYARSIQKRVSEIEDLANSLDSTGDMGVIASRWNDFMAGKIGKGDPRYAKLRANMGMFDSALGVVHQTRGIKMSDHFKELADAGKMDYSTFKASFGELKKWVDDYATMGANAPGALPVAGGPGTLPPPPGGKSRTDPLGIEK